MTMHEYEIPFQWTRRGFITVRASSPEEAVTKACALDGELCSGAQGEISDWSVTGAPREVA